MDERILQSLLQPEAYDDLPRSVMLKQTHVSYIFITDNYVYKVKKPVDFGFLNFTSVDRRRFYCEEEVRLNRRFSSDLYIGVVELRQTPLGASFAGDGPVIDYAVKMRRLPEEFMLDRLASSGNIDVKTMRDLAAKVAAFHLSAARSVLIDQAGSPDSIKHNWDENFRQVSQFVGITIRSEDLAMIQDWTDRFIAEKYQHFIQRIDGGFIRDCDGDLHLSNICAGEEITIFDCIEFNDRFRYLDTASDIAFLLMDLDYHFRPDLAGVFLDEYCRLTGDSDCLSFVRFYSIYRAFVRGKVASLTMQDTGLTRSERGTEMEKAVSYFRLARGYIIRERLQTTLIMIGGMIGSGKSTVARHLGRELGVQVLSSDRLRKELFPQRAAEKVQSGGIYTKEADTSTYAALLRRCMELLQSGESVIADATFRRKSDREYFRTAALSAGATASLFVTETAAETILARLEARKESPDCYSDAGADLYDVLAESYEWPDSSEEQFVPVQTSGDVRVGVDDILKSLRLIP